MDDPDPGLPRAASAWLQRCARVPSRVGQVWTRKDGFRETLLVIGQPELVRSSKRFLERLITGTVRSGWCHEVYCMEREARFFMNENWFFESEVGKGSVFGRVA